MLRIPGSIVAAMVVLSFAAVPFYAWFARATGFGGTTQVAADGLSRTSPRPDGLVRFDASRAAGCPWEFTGPSTATMRLRIGETGLAFFEAYNPTDKPVAGQASYQRDARSSRAAISPRSTASASACRCCNRVSGSRCR